MAQRKASKPTKKKIGSYDHKDKKRANNPPVGLVTPATDQDAGKRTYAYDPHLDPQLDWAGKAEHTSFELPTVSLHVHEHKGKYQVEVCGFDYYNPKDGKIESGDTSKIAMWMLDTDYDGRSLCQRQVFFPMAGPKDGWARFDLLLTATSPSGPRDACGPATRSALGWPCQRPSGAQ